MEDQQLLELVELLGPADPQNPAEPITEKAFNGILQEISDPDEWAKHEKIIDDDLMRFIDNPAVPSYRDKIAMLDKLDGNNLWYDRWLEQRTESAADYYEFAESGTGDIELTEMSKKKIADALEHIQDSSSNSQEFAKGVLDEGGITEYCTSRGIVPDYFLDGHNIGAFNFEAGTEMTEMSVDLSALEMPYFAIDDAGIPMSAATMAEENVVGLGWDLFPTTLGELGELAVGAVAGTIAGGVLVALSYEFMTVGQNLAMAINYDWKSTGTVDPEAGAFAEASAEYYSGNPYLQQTQKIDVYLTNNPQFVWVFDDGAVSSPDITGDKGGYGNDMQILFRSHPLPGTNLWVRGRIVDVIGTQLGFPESGYNLLFSLKPGMGDIDMTLPGNQQLFWVNPAVARVLKDDEQTVRACLQSNLSKKAFRGIQDYPWGESAPTAPAPTELFDQSATESGGGGDTGMPDIADLFRARESSTTKIRVGGKEFVGGEMVRELIDPGDTPNFDQTAIEPTEPFVPEPITFDDPVSDSFVQIADSPFFGGGQEDIGDQWDIPSGSPLGESMDASQATVDGWEPFNTIAQMRAGETLVRFEDTTDIFWDHINNGWVAQSALANPPGPFFVDYTKDTGTLMPDGVTPKWLLGIHRDSGLSYMPDSTVKYFLEVGTNMYFDTKEIPFQVPMLFSTDQRDFAQMMYTHAEYLTDSSGIVFKIFDKRQESNKNYFLLQTSTSTVKTWTTDPLMAVYHPSSKYEISVWKTEWAAYQVQAAKDARIAAKGQRHLTHVTQATERVKLAKANQGEKRRMYNKGRKQAEGAFIAQYRAQFDTQTPEVSETETRALSQVQTLTRMLKESQSQSLEFMGQLQVFQLAESTKPYIVVPTTGRKHVNELIPNIDYVLYPLYADESLRHYKLVAEVRVRPADDPVNPNTTKFRFVGSEDSSTMNNLSTVQFTNDPMAIEAYERGKIEATSAAPPVETTASKQLLDAEAEVAELRRRLVLQQQTVSLVPSRMVGSGEQDPRLTAVDYRPARKRRKPSPPSHQEAVAALPQAPVDRSGTDTTLVALLLVTAVVILLNS